MLAYYRAGRQADALRAYEEMRIEFARELGSEPSPELARLQQQILDHEPDLGARAVLAAVVVASPPSAGLGEGDEEERIGGAGTPFVGRDTELAQLLDLAPRPARASDRVSR